MSIYQEELYNWMCFACEQYYNAATEHDRKEWSKVLLVATKEYKAGL